MKYKIKIVRDLTSALSNKYNQIVSLTGIAMIFIRHKNDLFRVGDRLTDAQVDDLCDNSIYDITITTKT